jgi:hypothetical protein
MRSPHQQKQKKHYEFSDEKVDEKKKRKRPLRRKNMATVTRQKAKVTPTSRPRARLRQVELVKK